MFLFFFLSELFLEFRDMFLIWSFDIKGKVGVASKQKTSTNLGSRNSTCNDELNIVFGFIHIQLQ